MSVKMSVLIKALSMGVVHLGYVTRYLLDRWYLPVSQCTHDDEANYAENVKKDIAGPRNMKWWWRARNEANQHR